VNHDRNAVLAKIRATITRYGHHTYCVLGGEMPRFAYTIGVSPDVGAELLFAGGAWYSNEETAALINEVAAAARAGGRPDGGVIATTHGAFTLRPAHASWTDRFMLGALDYYGVPHVDAWQVLPPSAYQTVDVPDLSIQFDPVTAPVWRCLSEAWPYSINSEAKAVTNLAALLGKQVTDGLRRSEQVWELFAGADPDEPQDAALVVPIGTLLMSDPTLRPFLDLPAGEGLRREPGGAWRPRS
jgi:hypothetical protein